MIAEARSDSERRVAVEDGALHAEVRKRHAPGRSRFELDVKLAVLRGVTVIVGHSGAGKSTLLRCIAGLSNPDEGHIAIGDHVLFDSQKAIRLEPARRRIAFVFQDLALFPHLTVEENVVYGLRRLPATERNRRMREILASFQIEHLGRRFPREISGGEQQRVALARSLVTEPSVLLLDEPLSSLDPRTKLLIIDDLRRWNETRRIPILYVTHDHDELLALGDRAVVLEHGKIITAGSPLGMVPNPLRLAVAQERKDRFENVFDATVVERREQDGIMICELTGTPIRIEVPLMPLAVGSEVCIGVRADDILVASSRPDILGDHNVLRGQITRIERNAATAEIRVSCGAEFRVHLPSRSLERHDLDTSAHVWITIGARACHVARSSLFEAVQRLFVFVCQGNTIRSPMAEAICNAEIAARLGVPVESLDRLGIKAVSAGLTARPGQSIAVEAEHALGAIRMPAVEHRARNLTHAIAEKAEIIFCMTEKQRADLIERFPEAAAKTHCLLTPEDALGNPHGKSAAAFSELAQQLQELLEQKLDGLKVSGVNGVAHDGPSNRSARRSIEVSNPAPRGFP